MSVPSRIRAVIFDMDDVLTDFEPLINAAASAMFKEKGLHVIPSQRCSLCFASYFPMLTFPPSSCIL